MQVTVKNPSSSRTCLLVEGVGGASSITYLTMLQPALFCKTVGVCASQGLHKHTSLAKQVTSCFTQCVLWEHANGRGWGLWALGLMGPCSNQVLTFRSMCLPLEVRSEPNLDLPSSGNEMGCYSIVQVRMREFVAHS